MSETPTPATSEPSGPATVKVDRYNITSTTESADSIRENLSNPDETSKAASTLGKKGAEARKAKGSEPKPEVEAAADDGAAGSDLDAPAGDENKPLGKPRNDPRARMLEATRKEAEAKRERDAARAEAAAARAEAEAIKARLAPQAQAQTAPQSQVDPSKPRPEQFQNYEDFSEALADWKAEQKVGALKAEMAQQQAQREYEAQMNEFLGNAVKNRADYVKANPDFLERLSQEVIELHDKLSLARGPNEYLQAEHVIADEIARAWKRSGDEGARLMLEFSEHPDTLQRIRALPSSQDVQVEMRYLARTLDKPPAAVTAGAAPKGDVSRARPPVRPVTGSPHTASPELDSDSVPYDEFRRQKLASKR